MTTAAELGTFRDRREAGRLVADAVRARDLDDLVVLGLPRGGVPVAYEVAKALGAPLDVLVARKIGAPGNPELGIGAVAENGVQVLDDAMVRALWIGQDELEQAIARATGELQDRVRRYRGDAPPVSLQDRTAVVVDDGLATGSTARAAVRAARVRGARRVVLAVPVAAADSLDALALEADEVVCVLVPEQLLAVGLWYQHFGQTSDREVAELLARARDGTAAVSDDRSVRR